MFVTSAEQRGGLLVAIITGGRPQLKERPTAQFIDHCRAAGVADTVWAVSDRDAPRYEHGDADLSVYSQRDWAYPYARQHWMGTDPPAPDGFFGAFPGREWACQEAERRGCWGVLQLDDNIIRLGMLRNSKASINIVREHGGLGLFIDLLTAMALSTNARTVGAQLSSVGSSASDARTIIRPGFPYSCFIERVGPGREPWYGPFEDDITHSFQYGDRADGATAALVPWLLYTKESKSGTGMRTQYGQTRSVQLQRLIPQGAKVGIRATKSNGRGGPRVFHTMQRGAIRNPVIVRDHALHQAAAARLEHLKHDWYTAEREANRAKVLQRLAREQANNPTMNVKA
jgi:hypothetical protein